MGASFSDQGFSSFIRKLGIHEYRKWGADKSGNCQQIKVAIVSFPGLDTEDSGKNKVPNVFESELGQTEEIALTILTTLNSLLLSLMHESLDLGNLC